MIGIDDKNQTPNSKIIMRDLIPKLDSGTVSPFVQYKYKYKNNDRSRLVV